MNAFDIAIGILIGQSLANRDYDEDLELTDEQVDDCRKTVRKVIAYCLMLMGLAACTLLVLYLLGYTPAILSDVLKASTNLYAS